MRARAGGVDEVVPLGNSQDGWDEIRVEAARKQLLAKIELGLWTPETSAGAGDTDEEPTFRELATAWLDERLLGFGEHYRQIARPFEWSFTRQDLNALLARIDRHESQLALAA